VQFNPNGFTVTALQAAWAAITATPTPPLDPAIGLYPCLHLQQALQAAVRVGHDTDTVAAIAGWAAGSTMGRLGGAVAVAAGRPRLARRRRAGAGVTRHPDRSRGTSDASGWPIGERVATPDYDYTERPAIRHPYDDGVWLGTVAATGHDADAVISMCRLGVGQVPADGVELRDHLEAWLIDTDDSNANPNLDFVLADIASAIAGLRAESRRFWCTVSPLSSARRRQPSRTPGGLAYRPMRRLLP
jgi:hypothetical protein